MICEECQKGKVVLHAFSSSKCLVCGEEICTPHIPADKVCENCSNEKKLCKECGKPIEDAKKIS